MGDAAMRMTTIAAALLLLAGPLVGRSAAAQEALSIAPGHTLRFHASPLAEKPVTRDYSLSLTAGDWLVVNAPAAIIAGASTEPPIRLTGPAGAPVDESGRLVRRIETTGSYRLALKDFHVVAITRYPARHPVVETGLTAAQIRLSPGALGAVTTREEPMEPRYDDVPPPSGMPARFAIDIGGAMTVRIYRREALRQMDLWAEDPAAQVAGWIAGDGPIAVSRDLPLFPVENASVAYTARSERLRGVCFTFLRYLARWTQEAAWPFDNLAYVAIGSSRDGRWFATAIAVPSLTPLPGQPATQQDGTNPRYEAALTRQLATDPRALEPSLAALDAVAASIAPPCAAP